MGINVIKEEKGIKYFNTGDNIDLSELSRIKQKIDWKNSIGKHINIYYNNEYYTLNIIDYILEKQKIVFTINNDINNIKSTNYNHMVKGHFGGFLSNMHKYKYNIGDIVNGLEIIKQTRITENNRTEKEYIVRCIVDGYEYRTTESRLIRGNGCPVCAGKICKKNINSIWKTHPNLVKYFVNKEDSYTHTRGNKDKVLMKCPECGYEKEMTICDLINHGFSCPRCKDGFSFPNKIVVNIVSQLNIIFETEKCFDWSKNKRYDIYIPKFKLLIENHGRQHYEGGFERYRNGARTLKEEQENDKLKKELAIRYGYKYIEIDCRYSNIEYIKNSVINSDLSTILNFKITDIDWNKCLLYASSSLSKKTCDLWNKGIKNTKEIGNILGIDASTVRNYLRMWDSENMCNYDKELLIKSRKKHAIEKSKEKCEKAILITRISDGKKKQYASGTECSKHSIEDFGIQLNANGIRRVARGERKQYKGFTAIYI